MFLPFELDRAAPVTIDASAVLKEAVDAKPDDQEIREKLTQVAEDAEKKGWVTNLVKRVKEHKGDIADMAIHVGVRIGKALLGLPFVRVTP